CALPISRMGVGGGDRLRLVAVQVAIEPQAPDDLRRLERRRRLGGVLVAGAAGLRQVAAADVTGLRGLGVDRRARDRRGFGSARFGLAAGAVVTFSLGEERGG